MPYKLSATLLGHSGDVRAVVSPTHNLILSASRDTNAIAWAKTSSDSSFHSTIFHPSDRYCNAVGYLPPLSDVSDDYLVVGSQDALITAFSLKNPKSTPDYTLVGHSSNVCCLGTSNNENIIISGSWDKTARVWRGFKNLYVLDGHGEAVWAVLIIEPTKYLTGSADKTIRLWSESETTHVFRGHNDVVRGLALLPDLGFASCSNDSEIRVWTWGGDILYTLTGHTSFAYSVAVLPSGDIVSSGEDRTVRVWRDGECVQTLVHPAISVWCVSVMPNGDIVSGASDGVVRVFSESEERWASRTELEEYEEKIASQALNKEQLGGLKSSDIQRPDALLQPGRKDGQVILVQEGSDVNAYQWVTSSGSWIKAGQVVDAVGSNRKQIFEGKEYDYVFDVDVKEGAPPLKLCYNATENPYSAAQRFLEQNDLPNEYLDEIVKFIEKNTSGVSLGTNTEYVDPFTGASRYVSEGNTSSTQPQGSAYADPFTGASRYTSTTSGPPPQSSTAPRTKIIPVSTPIHFKQANVPAMRNKTYQLNDVLGMEISTSSLAISAREMYEIDHTFDELLATLNSSPHSSSPITSSHVEVLIQLLERWPVSQRFPLLDLARLISAFAPSAYATESQCATFLDALFNAAEWSESWPPANLSPKSRETNVLLTLRSVANVFQFGDNGSISPSVLSCIHLVLEQLLRPPYESLSKTHRVVLATIAFNISCLFLKTELSEETNDLYIQLLIKIISEEHTDSETIYRILVALGNYLYGLRQHTKSPGLQEAHQQVLRALVETLVESKGSEERIYNVGTDIASLL